jgi:hypothetical protein
VRQERCAATTGPGRHRASGLQSAGWPSPR